MAKLSSPQSNTALLDGGRFLADLFQKDSVQGAFMQKIITAINTLAKNTGASPVGEAVAPPPPNSVSVSASGEMLHIAIDHYSPINRPIHYFSEIATDSGFSRPIVVHHGPSRTPAPIPLPTYDGNGNKLNYYVRSYAQYPGSKPSEPTVFGGTNNLSSASVQMNGSTQLTLLGSRGSGTASPVGQQGGQGFGKQPTSQAIKGQSSAPGISLAQDFVAGNSGGSVYIQDGEFRYGPNLTIPIVNTVQVQITFSNADAPDGQDTTAQVVVTGQTWVTADSIILATIAGGTADHPTADEPAVEEINVSVGDIVSGVGFTVSAYAPNRTWGTYNVNCMGV